MFSIILKYNIIIINFQFFVGKELTPPMDTGEITIKMVTDSNLPIESSEQVLHDATPIIESVAKVLRISASIGSEAGVMSIGTGGGVNQISMKVSYINRFEREPDIWLIARTLREKLAVIPHLNPCWW